MSERRKIEEQPVQQEQPFHLKYRPQRLKDVIGQDAVVASLSDVVKSNNPGHAYLFTGPSGTGKTTLARILANDFKCSPTNILEIDAASNSGIDAMREVTGALRYHGFGDSPNRAIILDEVHGLSKQAWQSLLKTIEEPSPHVYIFLCTTESGKVPDTILTRCHSYTLKSVKFDDVMDLLDLVAENEKLRTPNSILQLVARACNGSPRMALVMLSMVRECEDDDEAARLLETPLDNKDVIEVCRLLVSGKLTWEGVVSTLKAIPDMNPESVRIVVVNYLAACLMSSTNEKRTCALLDALEYFSQPFNSSDKSAPLLRAFGKIIYPA